MWKLNTVVFEKFRLDGGAMFGVVPKTLWSKTIEHDELNRIFMVTRCLLLERKDKKVLVDCGLGSKWGDKERSIYAIESLNVSFDFDSVTDVLITHLHFDHAGGLTKKLPSGEIVPSFRNASVWISSDNLKTARSPNVREKASYLSDNFEPLENRIIEINSEGIIFDGIRCYFSNGHTRGLMWFEIETDIGIVFFPSDLMPTSRHKKLVYTMGYDMCVETILEEKKAFLELVQKKRAIVFFEHDYDTEFLSWDKFD
ncbi:MAG: MBL fold metallo-hydrolase [Deltaproteobacteria bacterium]|nr:MBL fold metallo-hydrolase [Deltaproteobacteria bacterium]